MKILLYAKLQDAIGVPEALLSPALYDKYNSDFIPVQFSVPEKINCIGIGYTDATEFIINNGVKIATITIDQPAPFHNGLYVFSAMSGSAFTVTHNGTFVGRVGLGEYRTLGTNPTKETGFYTTNESRNTMGGQVIPGAGGYTGRRLEADVRYKFDRDVYDDLMKAYTKQISKNFPFFILNDAEQHKLPYTMLHFYARTKDVDILLQSSTYKFLYSYKFEFYEAF
jgi:hypothetical protein